MRLSKLRSRAVLVDPQPEANAWTKPTLFYSLIAISTFSSGNFHPKLLSISEESNLQQIISVLLWINVILTSYFRRVVIRIPSSPGVFLALGVYAVAIVSPLWAANLALSLPKAVTLAIVNFGAYRLMRTLDLSEVVEAIYLGQLFLLIASIAVALLMPDIGVMNTFQHAGQWSGVFWSKQNLGILAATSLFFSCYRLLSPERRAYHAFGAVVAIICVLASGSRGGGGLVIFAVGCLFLTSRSITFARLLAFVPTLMGLLGAALVIYFVHTGNRFLVIFGNELDFTERTYIWRHALDYFTNRMWLGFGLNGFWTLPEVKDLFLERHGWFLDNYHDGYIAIVMETGVIGLTIFIIGTFFFGLRILYRIRIERGLDPQVALALVYTSLLYFIDFTETFFLRSTTISSILLVIFILAIYGEPGPRALSPESNPRKRSPPNIRAASHIKLRRA